MKLALVHDDFIQWGGAERLVSALHEVFPDAPIFTSFYDETVIRQSPLRNADLRVSFMQKLPLKKKIYRWYAPLFPVAFELFDLTEFDVVVSSSTRFAHGVLTKPGTIHIAYCNTPARMFWESPTYFEKKPISFVSSAILTYLRAWDQVASQRADYWIANSAFVATKIRKVYKKDADIIYPCVDTDKFLKKDFVPKEKEYFLVVSRLLSYKRIDLAIRACEMEGKNLVIIGDGPDRSRLEKLAGPHTRVLGWLTDDEVVGYYQNCLALIFPGVEYFGITPLEALAAGKPVIAARNGGCLESLIEGVTGVFFTPGNMEDLVARIHEFQEDRYQKNELLSRAQKFSVGQFQKQFSSYITRIRRKDLSV